MFIAPYISYNDLSLLQEVNGCRLLYPYWISAP
ncbi:hypothetical protein DFO54_104244 [Erwinia sp. AG740]|nr:hypothetical protein DFO54_104244 [Erwinia sp. AG740]